MIKKKEIEKAMTALEDIKGLYSQLEQDAADAAQKQEIQSMMKDAERHYQYLNAALISCKENS